MPVSRGLAACAALLITGALSAPVLADDPRDPTMTPEAIARDAATIRRLNREQGDFVRRRDAGYAQGWRDYDAERARASGEDAYAGADDYASRRRDYEEARADYLAQRREYDREMRQWRADSAACHAGYYERCGG